MKTHASTIPGRSRPLLAVLCAAALLGAPGVVRAQDDDMPDGDVDIIEKPKPKPKKKKEEPKKEEPKKEEKKAEKPKEEPKKDKKAPPPSSDDDDILTGGDSGAKIAPKGSDANAKAAPPVEDEGEGEGDGEDDEGEGGGRTRLLKAVEQGPPPVVADDVPARAPVAPIDDSPIEDDVPARPEAEGDELGGDGGDGGKPGKPVITPKDGDAGDTTMVETGPTGDEKGGIDEDGGDSTWVIVGATAGGLLLLAGAGVGGFFVIDALSPKTGTVTVTPR